VSEPQKVSLDRNIWPRLARAIREFAHSEVRGRAAVLAVSLVVLMLSVNGLNVANSYVGRDFMTAIEQRSFATFMAKALLYAGVFALSTAVAVLLRFCEERLALLWREWITRRLIGAYFTDRLYQRLNEADGIHNPDQRIADDARSFTATTISFLLMLLNGTFTIIAFSGVLWSISSLLFVVAVAYALAGTALTVAFGRPLVDLNYAQSDREAELRAELVRVREHADSIVLNADEGMLHAHALRAVAALVANTRRIIAVNRNVSFFTTGYSYGIQLIPALIVGPLFIRGQVEFGVISQSAMAFSHLLGAFSLVVTQFGSISSYAAVLARLRALVDAAGWSEAAPSASGLEIVDGSERLTWQGLTLLAPETDELLIAKLSATVEPGSRWLVTGPNATAQTALLRATAGVWRSGEGRILRPKKTLFLPESPYLPASTLAELLTPSGVDVADSEAGRIARLLEPLGLAELIERAGGSDREMDWERLLSLREQQLLSIARILSFAPRVAVLHEIGATLDPEHVTQVLALFAEANAAIVMVAQKSDRTGFDVVLDLELDGSWRLSS
jgi:vitamin B12/bleomycin/antimicrobial peptide transport system ATP-binding/permease protein